MPRPSKRPSAVREPIQVYLAGTDRQLLDRVAKKAGLSRAEVLRRGVRRMAADVLADESPMLAFMREQDGVAWPADTPVDVGEHHDKYLTDRSSATKTRSVRATPSKKAAPARRSPR